MKAIKPVFWHQGLFLQPQHFQILDTFYGSLLKPFQDYGNPFFWGVGDIRIQETALGTRQFEVLGGEFLFPDGTYAVVPGNTVIKPRSFQDAWVEGDKPFMVYLGVRKWNEVGENVTVVSSEDEIASVNTRFATTADPEDVVDLHSGGPPAKVKRLTQAVRIFWDTEQEKLDNYSFIPVAQLERNNEEIALSKIYIPPSLTVGASEVLTKMLREVRDQVASRCQQLEEYKDPKEVQTMMLALYVLNRQVPMLSQINETRQVSPWWAYALLRQLAGELSTFSALYHAVGERSDGTLVVGPYDHLNLGVCFKNVHDMIGELLDAIIAGPAHVIRLKYDGTYFSTAMPRDAFDRHNKFWVAMQTSADPKTAVGGMRQVAKLGTAKNLPTLIARAITGIPLIHSPGYPSGLPQRPNTHYFQIDTRSRLWQDVIESEALALYWDTAPKDVKLEIFVLEE